MSEKTPENTTDNIKSPNQCIIKQINPDFLPEAQKTQTIILRPHYAKDDDPQQA